MGRICLAIVGLMLLAAPAAASDGKETAARAVAAAPALKQQASQAAAAGKRLDFTKGPASERRPKTAGPKRSRNCCRSRRR